MNAALERSPDIGKRASCSAFEISQPWKIINFAKICIINNLNVSQILFDASDARHGKEVFTMQKNMMNSSIQDVTLKDIRRYKKL